MINVVVISNDLAVEIQLLEQQADINVTQISPTDLDNIIQKVAQYQPDIFIMEQGEENVNVDILGHFLSQHYLNTRNLVLCDETPTLEMLQNSGFKAYGYVLTKQRAVLDKAVRTVHSGEAWLPRKLVSEMLN